MNPDRGLGVKSIDVLVVLGPHIEKRILPLSANRTCQKLTIFWQIYWDCKNQTCNVTIHVIDDGRSNYSSISSDYIILTENISQKLGTADNHGQKVKDNLVDAKSKDNILATLQCDGNSKVHVPLSLTITTNTYYNTAICIEGL